MFFKGAIKMKSAISDAILYPPQLLSKSGGLVMDADKIARVFESIGKIPINKLLVITIILALIVLLITVLRLT